MAKQDRLLAKVYRVVGIRPLAGKVRKLMFGPTFLASAGVEAGHRAVEGLASLRSSARDW